MIRTEFLLASSKIAFLLGFMLLAVTNNCVLAIDDSQCSSRALQILTEKQINDGIIGKMEEKLRTGVLNFRFEQSSEIISLEQKEFADGLLYLDSSNSKMKWEYESPEQQFFLLDGDQYTFYQPSLEQASRGTLDAIVTSSLPLAFLVGKIRISSVFKVSTGCEPGTFELIPNDDDGVSKVSMTIDLETHLPKEIAITDLSGNTNQIVISPAKSVNKNPFELSIPDAVDIAE